MQEVYLPLDNCSCSSDWYIIVAGVATSVLKGLVKCWLDPFQTDLVTISNSVSTWFASLCV